MPTREDPARYIEPGQAERIMRIHKTVRGETLVVVDVTDHAVYIRVLPTSHPDLSLAIADREVFWGDISWDNDTQSWSCRLNGPGYRFTDNNPEKETSHGTLKSALRRARKHTQNRAGDPKVNLNRYLNAIPALFSPYPTDRQIERRQRYEAQYWANARIDLENELGWYEFDNQHPIVSEGDF